MNKSKRIFVDNELSKFEKIFGEKLKKEDIEKIFRANDYDKKASLKELCSTSNEDLSQMRRQLHNLENMVEESSSEGSGEEKIEESQKSLMRTAEDVFNRITWDEKYDHSTTLVGYSDRFYGIKEAKFETWLKRRDPTRLFIPWHRVQYFKAKGQIIWDRRTRVNLVFPETPIKST